MRRRPPHLIHPSPEQAAYLRSLVRDGRVQQRIARRARILLAMAEPGTVVQELAKWLDVDRTTIWTLCRRFEELGVEAVEDAPRSGRPRELSPPCSAWKWSNWRAVSRRESACR